RVTGALTMEAWINLSSGLPSEYESVMTKTNWPARAYGMQIHTNGSVHVSFVNAGGLYYYAQTAAGTFRAGIWNHLVGIINPAAGVIQVYVNGTLSSAVATSGSLAPLTGVPVRLGYPDPG